MTKKLDPLFETMFLLCICPWGDAEKTEMIKELEQIGVDGQDFYHRNFRIIERYYQTFYKHMKPSAGYDLLHEMESIVMAVCGVVFLQNPDWLADKDAITDEAAQTAIIKAIQSEDQSDEIDKGNGLIESLEAAGLSDSAKWQMIVFVERAGHYLRLISKAISENIPAFEIAYKKVESEANVLLKSFNERAKAPHKTGLMRLPNQINSDTVIIPTLAIPISVLMLEDTCFYGLLSNKMPAGDSELSKDDLLICAKALSEKSKMEILLGLKSSSRYNLEIAELVNLAPATVSHHMNALLASGFVEFEKRDGKVYYKLAEEGIKNYLTAIKKMFLS